MADRVGVISKGELIAVDEKRALMAKMGRKTLDVILAEPLAALPPELSEWNLELNDDGHVLRYEFDSHADRTGIASLMRRLTDLGIAYKDLSTRQSSLEDIFVELVHGGARERTRELARHCGDLSLRNGALEADAMAKPDYSGDHDGALFRRVRLGPRKPDDEHGRRQLRRLHRPWPDASLRVHAVHLQRKFRHLFSEVYRHDLRTSLSSDLEFRGCSCLCRRGSHQVRDPGARHHRYGDPVRPRSRRSSGRDDPVPGRDQRRLLPFRLRDRRVGAEFRAASDHPDADYHAAHLPRRRLLLGEGAPRAVSNDHPVQSDRARDQRVPLEFLLASRTCRSGRASSSRSRSSPSAWQ